jgi:hypothetical protein
MMNVNLANISNQVNQVTLNNARFAWEEFQLMGKNANQLKSLTPI